MFDTQVTVVGNLVDDPIGRRTANGVAVVNFRVASTSRRFDREAESWVDGDSVFLNVTCWREMAMRTMGVLKRGDPVVVMGRLFTRQYMVGDEVRRSFELEARAIGPNMARIDVNVARRDPTLRIYEVVEDAAPADEGTDEAGSGELESEGVDGAELAAAGVPVGVG